MKLLTFGKVSCVTRWNRTSLNVPWSAFENKKPSLYLQAVTALCLVNIFQAWIWIFNINFHAQPWSQFSFHTFDFYFLILPEVRRKRVIEIRVFFLCCLWWLSFLFSHCARCINVFCLVFYFVHCYIVMTVGSVCPWALNMPHRHGSSQPEEQN